MRFFEVEQKYRLKDPQRVRVLLKKAGAKKTGAGSESNEFFDRDGFFAKQKIALRLRRHSNRLATLTLKGPRLKARFTKRMEIEVPVDYRVAQMLLATLGCKKIMEYTKKRETYRLGRALVTLDHLPKFGWFLEIEAQPAGIAKIASKLGLRSGDKEPRSYLKMLFNYRG